MCYHAKPTSVLYRFSHHLTQIIITTTADGKFAHPHISPPTLRAKKFIFTYMLEYAVTDLSKLLITYYHFFIST